MFSDLHGVPVFGDTRDAIAAAIVAAMQKLDDDTRGCAVPSADIVRDILARVTTACGTRAPGNAWRFLKRPRDSRDDVAGVFLHRFEWHTGRGSANLYRTFSDLHRVPRPVFELLDTVAAVLSHMCGRLDVSHSVQWGAVLGVGNGGA
jgi:hypothetical protein